MSHLKFPEFDDIKVSTKTFIVITNLQFNIELLFKTLPITPYTVIEKKRGRKKKTDLHLQQEENIPSGSIICLEFERDMRGADIKKKKLKETITKKTKFFRNSLSVVMMMNEDEINPQETKKSSRRINFKISRNGKFQVTGCKYISQAQHCIKYIWNYIKEYNGDIYTMNGDKLTAIFVPAMRNIDFSLNFNVDREKLNDYINLNTPFYSLLETSFGYTGANIKIPYEKSITKLLLEKFTMEDEKWKQNDMVPYTDYLETLDSKEKDKKIKKPRYCTFLCFHSGRVIVSGLDSQYMKPIYNKFLDIIRECHHLIEEKLTV